jgi:hypothetical protein
MIRTTVIGTCIYCQKLKAVKLNERRYIPSRREGICEECEHLAPQERKRLLMDYQGWAKKRARKKR